MYQASQRSKVFYGIIVLLLALGSIKMAYAYGTITAATASFGATEYSAYSFDAPCSRLRDPITGSMSAQPFTSIQSLLTCLNAYPVYPVCVTTPCYAMSAYNYNNFTSYPSTRYRVWCGDRGLYCNIGDSKPSCPAGYSLPSLPFPQQANVCVANSMANASCNLGLSCTCNLGFAPDASARSCVLQCPAGQQANAAGTACVTPPPSTCPAGQVPHQWGGCMLACPAGSFPNLRNTACVASTCPIPPLTPLVDAASLDFENGTRWRPDLLTPAYQVKLKCVQDGIVARGGTYIGTSAYRPIPYQKHLLEVVTKDAQLKRRYMGNHPECQALKTEITAEMGPLPGHALKFKQLVSTTVSRHNKGTVFDLTPIGLTQAQMLPIYAGCGVVNTAVKGELWHTQ